jgi:hypothetical protein
VNLLMERSNATTDEEIAAVQREYQTNIARYKELCAERMDFNRWKPKPPALETAFAAFRPDRKFPVWKDGTVVDYPRLLRMYLVQAAEFYSDNTRQEQRAVYEDKGRAAKLEEFKRLPVEFRKAFYRCYKGGLILETATLKELQHRASIRADGAKAPGGNTFYERKNKLFKRKKETRFNYKAPARVMKADGTWETITFENPNAEDFGATEKIGE